MPSVRCGLVLAVLALLGAGCSPAPTPPSSPILAPAVTAEVTGVPAPLPDPAPVATDGDRDPAGDGGAGANVLEALLAGVRSKSQCADFDYFPHGGLQSLWCHRGADVTVASIRALAGVDVFTSGPHAGSDLKLDAANDFGRYNPAFVKWLVEGAAPSPRGSAGQQATQPFYDAHLKHLTEIFWKTYEKAKRDDACFMRERTAYQDLVKRKQLPRGYYERWFFFMNPYWCEKGNRKDQFYYDNAFDAGVDGNVTKSAIGFWLRRSIDGTMDGFAEGLKKLVASYEPELLTPSKPADPAALTRALDAGVKASAACKDPKATAPSAYVEIKIAGNGTVSAQASARSLRGHPQLACVEAKLAAQKVPPFDGPELRFTRSVPLK